MRSLTRIGVAAAATAIASATAFAGAGVAGAQDVEPVFNSPSSVSVEGKGAATKVSYTNRSEYDLGCFAYAGPAQLIGDLYGEAKKSGITDDVTAELDLRLTTALTKGQLGVYVGIVEKGKTTVLPSVFDGSGVELPEGAVGLTDGSFAPAALTICSIPGGATYSEVEVSAGVGVPAGLGSLDSALTGLGSSGSVAETTGSLGS